MARNKKTTSKTQNKTHAIDFWHNNVTHNSDAQYARDTYRLQLLINEFASPYLEDFEKDPLMIHDAIKRLGAYRIPKGTHKGERYSKKTIGEAIKVLKKIMLAWTSKKLFIWGVFCQ